MTLLVVAAVIGAGVAGLVALENLDFRSEASSRRMVFLAGCGGALVVPLVEGSLWLVQLGVPLMLPGLVLGALVGVFADPDRGGSA